MNATTTGMAHTTAAGANPSRTSGTAWQVREITSLTGWKHMDVSQSIWVLLWWTAWNGHRRAVWNHQVGPVEDQVREDEHLDRLQPQRLPADRAPTLGRGQVQVPAA